MRALALLLLAACAFPTPQQQQRSYAESLRPAEVKPSSPVSDIPVRKLRVRAYADADYQQQTPRWKARIEQQVERASGILERQFGVRLEVESVRPWQRVGGGDRLQDALDELAASDPGAGVDWVLAFISSLRVFTATQEELGTACMFCRHFVLRGMFSAAESDAIDRALPLLSGTEREELARERRVHKETAVFLHEWAHTLGAFHERLPQSLMAPMYDTSQSAFSEASARIIGLGLEYRDVPASRPTWNKAYRAEVERSRAEAWDAGTRDAALAAADFLLATARERPKQKLPDADAAALQKAIALETEPRGGEAEDRRRGGVARIAAAVPGEVQGDPATDLVARGMEGAIGVRRPRRRPAAVPRRLHCPRRAPLLPSSVPDRDIRGTRSAPRQRALDRGSGDGGS